MNTSSAPATIDAYIQSCPENVRGVLSELRETIRKAAPEAQEKISYQIPTFYLKGNLVHFAAFSKHIGFYPAPRAVEGFSEELERYKGSKGTVQFPIGEPLPLDLITRMVQFRVQQNLQKLVRRKRGA